MQLIQEKGELQRQKSAGMLWKWFQSQLADIPDSAAASGKRVFRDAARSQACSIV